MEGRGLAVGRVGRDRFRLDPCEDWGEPGRFRFDAPCVGMQVAQIGQTDAVRMGIKTTGCWRDTVASGTDTDLAMPNSAGVACGPGQSSGAPERRRFPSSPKQPRPVHSSLEVGDTQQGFDPKSLLTGGTSQARCKPCTGEDEAQELGGNDPGPTEYPESCRISKTGIEAASGTRRLGKASDWGLCTPKSNGSWYSDRCQGRSKVRLTIPATDPSNRSKAV